MFCPTCKSPNQPGGRFCTACGSQLVLTCSACGFANTPSDRFCGGCGKATTAVAVAEPTAHHAVVQRRAGDGERKRVTVLFAARLRTVPLPGRVIASPPSRTTGSTVTTFTTPSVVVMR